MTKAGEKLIAAAKEAVAVAQGKSIDYGLPGLDPANMPRQRIRDEAVLHPVKCWPKFFEPIYTGLKNFEMRQNDRDYREGDVLRVHEYHPDLQTYTGRFGYWTVTYVFHPHDLAGLMGNNPLLPGWCVMSLRRLI